MFSMFAKKTLLGLDIGSSSVKLVELERSGSTHRLRRFGYAPVPPEAIVQGSFMNATGISEAIQQAYENGGFKTKDVATSVSGHAVIVKRISLPSQSAEELDETIKWEAEQYIPFDIAEVNIDYQVLQDDALDGQMDVVLVAAKKDLIDDYLNVISDAGLSMAIMDVDAFALGNMYELNYDPSPESAVALVDIGASVININVMNGAVPVFTRDITSGGNQYTEEIQKALSISFEEAERIKIGGTGSEVSTDVVPQEVEDAMREVERQVMLRIIDQRWREHLYEMDHLREGIHLRAMGQRDPTTEWQREGFDLFGQLTDLIGADFLRYVMRIQVTIAEEDGGVPDDMQTSGPEGPVGGAAAVAAAAGAPATVTEAPPGPVQKVNTGWDATPRNAPCPCDSGRKFKHCHGR